MNPVAAVKKDINQRQNQSQGLQEPISRIQELVREYSVLLLLPWKKVDKKERSGTRSWKNGTRPGDAFSIVLERVASSKERVFFAKKNAFLVTKNAFKKTSFFDNKKRVPKER